MNHPYRRLFLWKSKEELAGYLYQHILHQSDGIIATIKPFGVGIRSIIEQKQVENEKLLRSGKDVKKPDTTTNFDPLHHIRGTGSCEFTLEDAIPNLSKRLGVPKLYFVKTTEKYTSGVAVFCTDEKVVEKVKESIKLNKQRGITTYSYYVISTNLSKILKEGGTFSERVGITLGKTESSKIPHPIVVRDFSKNAMMTGDVTPVNIDLNLLSKNHSLNVCLSKFDTTSIKSNFLRIYYANIVSPILGDHLYSQRVSTVGGVMSLIPPAFARIGVGQQVLPSSVLSTLRLQDPKDSIVIPLHAHLTSLNLGCFYGKGKHLTITAPPPPHFAWTCKNLSLDLPTINV